jgi:tetratricopeptide (TPR) repeat protein
MNAGHLNEALEAFEKALAANPSLAQAAYNQGVVLARQNKVQQAIKSFRTSVSLRPGFVMARFGLGLALKMAKDPAAEDEIRKAHLMKELLPASRSTVTVSRDSDNSELSK